MEPVLSGEAAAVDADAVCQHLFSRVPSEHFHSAMLAFEFVQFCRDHLVLFSSNLDLLRTSFPNLFKARELGPWGSGDPCLYERQHKGCAQGTARSSSPYQHPLLRG